MLSLPLSLKIGGVEESRQKLVLRQVAKLQGVPNSVSERPKRAIQYTTGVATSIRMLSRKASLAPQEYISKIYNDMRREMRSRTPKLVG